MSAASFQSATPHLQHRWRSSCLSVALDDDQTTSNYTCPTTPDSILNKEMEQRGRDLGVLKPFIAAQWHPALFTASPGYTGAGAFPRHIVVKDTRDKRGKHTSRIAFTAANKEGDATRVDPRCSGAKRLTSTPP